MLSALAWSSSRAFGAVILDCLGRFQVAWNRPRLLSLTAADPRVRACAGAPGNRRAAVAACERFQTTWNCSRAEVEGDLLATRGTSGACAKLRPQSPRAAPGANSIQFHARRLTPFEGAANVAFWLRLLKNYFQSSGAKE